VQTSASTESVAAEATATPSSEAIPEGQRSVAPVIGTGEAPRACDLAEGAGRASRQAQAVPEGTAAKIG
jgi:hypothetical protein